MMKYLLCLALLGSAGAWPLTVHAQSATQGPSAADRATARRLATEGQIALKKGDFDTAADRFERANDLLAAPTFLVRLARARTGQGRLVEAYEIYRKIIRDGVEADKPEPFKRALADAKQEMKAVEPRLAWVSVNVVGASANEVEVSLNGAVIPSAALGAQRPVDPGTLRAKATAEGYRPAEAEVQLAEGEHLPAIELRMVALPKPEPLAVSVNDSQTLMTANGGEPGFFSQRSLGYIGIGLGGAGLAVGGITGILAYQRHHELFDTPCQVLVGNHCWVSDKSSDARAAVTRKQAQMRHFATAATVSFIAGGALAATGLLLLVTAENNGGSQGSGQTVLPYVSLGTIGAVGSF